MLEEDVYVPDEGDWKDWEELAEQQRRWNKKTFTLVIKGIPRETSREKFIEYLRRVIIVNVKDYTTKTRREIVAYLEGKFQVQEELRRYCDLSEDDFNKMLDGASFPYLTNAWNALFHPGILQDMDDDRRVFQQLKSTVQSKRDQSAEQSKTKKQEPKTTEKDAKEKRVAQAPIKEPEKKVERRGRKSQYAWKIDDELLHKDYSLEAFLKQLSSELTFNRFAARAVNNTVKVLLFRQKLQLLYAEHPVTLKEFTKLCSADKVPITRIDLLLGTKHLFSNIYAGSTKGIHQSEDLKILFRKAFGIELSLD